MVAGTSHDADLARRKIVGDGTGHQIALQVDMRIERRHQRDAHTNLDQVLRGPVIIRAVADIRLESGTGGQFHQICAAGGAAGDPMLVFGGGQRHRFAGLLESFGDAAGAAHQQSHRVVTQRMEGQVVADVQEVRDAAVAEHGGGIGLALGNQADRLRRLHLNQAQLDVREHTELDHGTGRDSRAD